MTIRNIDIVKVLDQIRIHSLYVHNEELDGASFSTERLKDRKVYLVETLAVLNALAEKGTMLLYGGHGGGKTTLSKYLGQIFCHKSKDKIEESILRGHPQLTEEKILGSLDIAQLTGAKPLNKDDKIDVIWNDFVDSEWKIIDEVNRLSPYAQNILLSLLAESTVKYHNESKWIPKFTLYATMNPKDEGHWNLSLPFLDRFGMALPITMPDYDSFSTIGEKDNSLRKDNLEKLLPQLQLSELQKDVKTIRFSEEADLFVNFLIASYRLCERVSKESNEDLSVDKNLCEGCHMKAPEKVCNKIKQPLSVRVKEDLKKYGKALAWFLGDNKVETKHIMAIAPYIIWHRTLISKAFLEEQRSLNRQENGNYYITNLKLVATKKIMNMIYKEFEGVKKHLADFEKIKEGKLSIADFNNALSSAKNPNNNFLILKQEIIPILENKYLPVYSTIVEMNKKIDKTKEPTQLRRIKDELIFSYDIPNRQFLTDRIDKKIQMSKAERISFTLNINTVERNKELCKLIASRWEGFPERQLPKLQELRIRDIVDDECDLTVLFNNSGYCFTYKGDNTTEIFKLLKDNAH